MRCADAGEPETRQTPFTVSDPRFDPPHDEPKEPIGFIGWLRRLSLVAVIMASVATGIERIVFRSIINRQREQIAALESDAASMRSAWNVVASFPAAHFVRTEDEYLAAVETREPGAVIVPVERITFVSDGPLLLEEILVTTAFDDPPDGSFVFIGALQSEEPKRVTMGGAHSGGLVRVEHLPAR